MRSENGICKGFCSVTARKDQSYHETVSREGREAAEKEDHRLKGITTSLNKRSFKTLMDSDVQRRLVRCQKQKISATLYLVRYHLP